MRVAVTGATGFIGTALLPELEKHGHEPVPVPRGSFDFGGAEAVVHLAGLAHRSGPNAPSAAEFTAVNAELPVRVYRAARDAGVRQMIHVSTISVLSGNRGTLTEDMVPVPTNAYERAKAHAEAMLLGEDGGLDLTILRPPLVYGPGAKGNLLRLMKLCATRWPLPFGAIHNRRSLIALANLVDALAFLLDHPAQGIVHVTDGHDLALRDLVTAIRAGMGREPGLFPVPAWLLRLFVPRRTAGQLFGDQPVDMGTLPALGWRPPHPPEYDLSRMGRAYGYGASSMSRSE